MPITRPATDKVSYLLSVREQARLRGDRGVYRACTADLARLGHVDPPAEPTPPEPEPKETTQAEPPPERAVPPAPTRRAATRRKTTTKARSA